MKKLLVIGIVMVMVMGLAVAASAQLDNTWMAQLRAVSGTPALGSGNLTLGTKVGANDGFTITAGEDGILTPATGTPGEIISNIVPGQRTNKDVRAPVTGATKVWDLSMYIVGGAAGTVTLTGWMATGVNMLDHSVSGPDVVLNLYEGTNSLWTVPYSTSGSQLAPMFTQTFTLDAGQTLALRLVATSVPEPGSMVALFSGLIGLVGFGIRRRK